MTKTLPLVRASLRKWILFCGLAMVAGLSIAGETLCAQAHAQVQRVVQGKVEDKGGAAISGAVVYLKDDQTMNVKSFITDTSGDYRFGQLSQNVDYELWAESNGKKSATKSISSFDSKNTFVINLKIDTGK